MKDNKKALNAAIVCAIAAFLGDYTQQLYMGIRIEPNIFLCTMSGVVTGGIVYLIFKKLK